MINLLKSKSIKELNNEYNKTFSKDFNNISENDELLFISNCSISANILEYKNKKMHYHKYVFLIKKGTIFEIKGIELKKDKLNSLYVVCPSRNILDEILKIDTIQLDEIIYNTLIIKK